MKLQLSSGRILLLAWIAIISLSCEETVVSVPVQPQSLIIGTWDWFESDGGDSGYNDTSDYSTTLALEFKPDSVLLVYVNGVLDSQRKYCFLREYEISVNDSIEVLVIESSSFRAMKYMYEISNQDTLKLEARGVTDVGYSKFRRR